MEMAVSDSGERVADVRCPKRPGQALPSPCGEEWRMVRTGSVYPRRKAEDRISPNPWDIVSAFCWVAVWYLLYLECWRADVVFVLVSGSAAERADSGSVYGSLAVLHHADPDLFELDPAPAPLLL